MWRGDRQPDFQAIVLFPKWRVCVPHFGQIPLVEVAVGVNAMERKLPKGATPSSNLAGSWGGVWTGRGMATDQFSKRLGAQGRGARKGIEMGTTLREVCHSRCALPGRGWV